MATAISLAGLPAACSDVVEERYETFADAQAADAADRGWLPSLVPTSATDIHDVHDLDTNAQVLTFNAPAGDLTRIIEGLPEVAEPNDASMSAALAEVGWTPRAERVSVYAVCASERDGMLILDLRSEEAAYIAPVRWQQPPCP